MHYAWFLVANHFVVRVNGILQGIVRGILTKGIKEFISVLIGKNSLLPS